MLCWVNQHSLTAFIESSHTTSKHLIIIDVAATADLIIPTTLAATIAISLAIALVNQLFSWCTPDLITLITCWSLWFHNWNSSSWSQGCLHFWKWTLYHQSKFEQHVMHKKQRQRNIGWLKRGIYLPLAFARKQTTTYYIKVFGKIRHLLKRSSSFLAFFLHWGSHHHHAGRHASHHASSCRLLCLFHLCHPYHSLCFLLCCCFCHLATLQNTKANCKSGNLGMEWWMRQSCHWVTTTRYPMSVWLTS